MLMLMTIRILFPHALCIQNLYTTFTYVMAVFMTAVYYDIYIIVKSVNIYIHLLYIQLLICTLEN